MNELLHEREINQETTNDTSYQYKPAVRKLFAIFTTVAAIGWAVSVFLTGVHFWVLPLPTGFDVTGTPWAVMTSEWAYVLGIPLALLGAFYYLTVLLLAGLWYHSGHPLVLKILTPISATGVIASAFFVYLQLFVIEAICPFCMVSAVASTTLFVIELLMLRMSKLPPIRELLPNVRTLLDRRSLISLFLMLIVSVLPVLSFWFATIVPAPGG
ncbi:vitamin K epoxide reductase family protein [Evansella cellulosilytica]|uniref:Vitamin K epoxide reductase n=1 Tax=Evansella cellulosilytica (strain ATCC 21833 / DSM 2522 / FERM P-1141 / JCM 9156 / N-4) TaxID=649639 RepID=E6TVW9_EVAC2|nr:vitamin K epoxide reductase family protein [Evansella cellulosilytica]ADU28678.1 Vitamin K epoxide reductase [Evansella cellulosilytica DSM 2522]